MSDPLTPSELARIKEVVDKRLIQTPAEYKQSFPKVLKQEYVSYIAFVTDSYFMLAMLDDQQKARVRELSVRGIHPFPGLISEDDKIRAAIRLENSRNSVLVGNTVQNLVSLSLGQDCSVVIVDHRQTINIAQVGPLEYVVQLAYVLSFGRLINRGNMVDFLEDLIAYSIRTWRPSDAQPV